ncbi:hypothetical protein VTN02DRAFT_4931 [Thermoascus thermophilus]
MAAQPQRNLGSRRRGPPSDPHLAIATWSNRENNLGYYATDGSREPLESAQLDDAAESKA